MAETEKLANTQLSQVGGYIGQGTKVNGKFHFEGTTTIEGEVSGEILVHGGLIVGEHATIEGKIVATTVLVRGKVSGDIQAEKRIEIQPPGVLLGDITTQNLVIGDGAIFEGNSFMKKEQKEGKVLPLTRQGTTPPQTEAQSSDPSPGLTHDR